jgi:hypothetical protein
MQMKYSNKERVEKLLKRAKENGDKETEARMKERLAAYPKDKKDK